MQGYLLHPVFAFGSLPNDDVIKITKSLTSVIVNYFQQFHPYQMSSPRKADNQSGLAPEKTRGPAQLSP